MNMAKLIYTKGIDDASGMDVTMVGNWIPVDTNVNWRNNVADVVNQLLNERPDIQVMNFADYADEDFIITDDPIADLIRFTEGMLADSYRVHKICVMIEDETNQIMVGDDDTCAFGEDADDLRALYTDGLNVD